MGGMNVYIMGYIRMIDLILFIITSIFQWDIKNGLTAIIAYKILARVFVVKTFYIKN